MSIQIQRYYYPDGKLHYEIPQQNGRAHGLVKEYHPNGQLAIETPNENGLVNGIVRAWDSEGHLLGEYTLAQGNGIIKTWHANGVLWGEVTVMKGMPTGLQKTWYEDGVRLPDTYWLRGKRVSRKKYFEACAVDSGLPQYPEKTPVGKKARQPKHL